MLFISLHVQAVELIILVKPIGILTHMLMSISFCASKGCRDKCDISCFKILDHASTYSQLKIKESFHIEQLKPELNKQAENEC